MRCSTRVLVLLLLVVPIASVSSLTLESVLPDLSEKDYSALRAWEMLEAQTTRGGGIKHLAPKGSMAYERAAELEELEEGFSICNVTFIPYPYDFRNLTLEQRMLSVYNTMRSVSTQEGITYISYRRGNEPHLLIRDSWYLASPRSRSRQPDPATSVLPEAEEYFVYQRDTSFGGNVYSHFYTIGEREIFLDIENLETMRVLSILPVVRPNQLNISMSAFFLDEGLLLFGSANIDRDPVVSFLGYTVHLPSAFNRRITALQEWFISQLYAN